MRRRAGLTTQPCAQTVLLPPTSTSEARGELAGRPAELPLCVSGDCVVLARDLDARITICEDPAAAVALDRIVGDLCLRSLILKVRSANDLVV